MWMPLRLGPNDFGDRDNNDLQVLARMKPGTTLNQARAEMNAATGQLERMYPKRERADCRSHGSVRSARSSTCRLRRA